MYEDLPFGARAIMRAIHEDAKRWGDTGQWVYCNGKLVSDKFPKGFASVPEHVGPLLCRLRNAYNQLFELMEEADEPRTRNASGPRGRTTARVKKASRGCTITPISAKRTSNLPGLL